MLREPASNGHVETCRVLLDAGAKADQPDATNRTPVDRAAFSFTGRHSDDVLRLFLESGYDLLAASHMKEAKVYITEMLARKA